MLNKIAKFFAALESMDRRMIYLFVAVSVALPLVFDFVLPPAEMKSATAFFDAVHKLESAPGKIVLIALDWGPGTSAENEPQSAVAIEHLMRKRIPFALITNYTLAPPYLERVPREVADKLMRELPDQKWTYGEDWVNLGYRPGGYLMIQGLAKAEDVGKVLQVDVNGTPLRDLPCFATVSTINDFSMLMQFTGLVGTFSTWVQFFQKDGKRPPFVHGCTSITIPEAHIFLSSKQIVGLLEGAAGAAWYEDLLIRHFPQRTVGKALKNNTALAVAQLLIIALVLIGNFGQFMRRFGDK